MNNNFSLFCSLLLGPSGRNHSELGTYEDIVCYGLFRTYFMAHKLIDGTALRKYCNGTLTLPRKIMRYYSGSIGYDHNYADMYYLVHASTSIIKLRNIQTNIKNTLCLPPDVHNHFIETAPSRDDIATYLAHVLHHILCSNL